MSAGTGISRAMVEARGLSKYYGNFIAVEGLSFAVERGSITAFLGPNGAGKSTIMKMLTGYMAPSKGEAFIGGLPVSSQRIEVAKMIGYLPENGPLYHDMSPDQYLRFVGEVRGLKGPELEKRLEYVIDVCHLSSVLYKPTGKLSKGFKQRVGLANSLLHDPPILILDEPTSGLDPNQIADVRTLLAEIGKTKTILLSTHILQEVAAVATDVLLISEGRLVFSGKPAELGSTPEQLAAKFHDLTGYQHTRKG